MAHPLAPVFDLLRTWIPADWTLSGAHTLSDYPAHSTPRTAGFGVGVFAHGLRPELRDPQCGDLIANFHADTLADLETAVANWIANVAALADIGAPLCIDCDEQQSLMTLATEDVHGDPLCRDCYDGRAEAAYDRSCEDFYGGSGPVTDAERMEIERREGVRR